MYVRIPHALCILKYANVKTSIPRTIPYGIRQSFTIGWIFLFGNCSVLSLCIEWVPSAISIYVYYVYTLYVCIMYVCICANGGLFSFVFIWLTSLLLFHIFDLRVCASFGIWFIVLRNSSMFIGVFLMCGYCKLCWY